MTLNKIVISVGISAGINALVPVTAYAADSNVTLYGIADAYVGYQDDNRATSGDGGVVVNSGGQSTSRWGIKGSESIGAGLSAIFQYEAAIATDVGASADFRRRSYVGLKGNFGQITLGRNYTPLFWATIDNDVARFGHDVNDANLGQANRIDNGLYYQRKFGAVTLDALYGPNESGGDDTFGLAIRYKSASWRASVGYHDEAGASVIGLGAQVGFGGFKIGFNAIDDDNNADTNFGLSLGSKIGGSGDVVFNAKRLNTETHFQIYYRQKMSKRTNWYVGYGDEDTNGAEIRAGVRHRF